MKKFIILFLLIALPVFADQVQLKDGSVIKGKIVKVHKDKLYLESELIGKITVSMENVTDYKTDEAVSFKNEAGTVRKETYDSKVNEQIKTLWSGENDPDVFVNHWNRLIWLNFVKKEGNKDETNLDGGLEFKYLRQFDTLKLYANFTNNTRNDTRTSDDYTWGADYELRFGDRQLHSWYLRAEYEKDRIKEIDLRSTYATGYGYYFIKNPKTQLRGRAGLLYRQENYIDDETEESIGIDFGLNFQQTFCGSLKWYTDLNYAPAFEDYTDFTLIHESGLEIPFDLEVDLSLKTGVRHEYDSRPAEDASKLDTRYFMRLQLKF